MQDRINLSKMYQVSFIGHFFLIFCIFLFYLF